MSRYRFWQWKAVKWLSCLLAFVLPLYLGIYLCKTWGIHFGGGDNAWAFVPTLVLVLGIATGSCTLTIDYLFFTTKDNP